MPIVNYSRKEYNAGSQNWQIVDYNGFMYFANKMGVLEYNGKDWRLFPLDNNTEVRSILRSLTSNRLYVAGINEVGYLSPNSKGCLEYTQISGFDNKFIGSIWRISEATNALYFTTDKYVIRYENEKITLLESPEKIDCSKLIDNTLYIGTPEGIYTLAGDKLVIYNKSKLLRGQKIRSIEKFDKDILVATSSGLFLMNTYSTEPFLTEADSFIRENSLFSLALNETHIAIGSILRGGVLMDKKGKVEKYFNESHGLQNNTILSMTFDSKDNLWLGLDNGIDYLLINDDFTDLYRTSSYGAGFAAALYNGSVYVGTNRGVFTYNWPITPAEMAPQLKMLKNTQGQVWSIHLIRNNLFIAHDKGLFIVEGSTCSKVSELSGVWLCKAMKKNPDNIWVATYTGFYILKKVNGIWKAVKIADCDESIYNFAEDADGRLWINRWSKEIAFLTFDEKYSKVLENRTIKKSFSGKIHINEIDQKVVFCANNRFYHYNQNKEEFDSISILPPSIELADSKFITIQEYCNKLWVLTDKEICILDSLKKDPQVYLHNLPLISNFEQLVPINDSSAFIGNESGITLWEKKGEVANNIFRILEVSVTKPVDSVIFENNFTGLKSIPIIPYSNNAIKVNYVFDNFSLQNSTMYRTKLDDNPWSNLTSTSSKLYSDLSIGTHVFYVEAVSRNRVYSDSISFEILPPWYRSNWAYGVYCVLFIAFSLTLNKLDNIRIRQKEKELQLQKEKELEKQNKLHKEEQLLKQQEIVDLQRMQLEMDLKHKSMELADITFSMIRKNEILGELKSDIEKLIQKERKRQERPKLDQYLVALIGKIDTNIEQDDSLKKFEEHFDLVHNNFMQRLSEHYPNLAMNEKKMCAFIKMELTTKEISPLLNISVRGVETMRYRLRKKFNLERDESLSAFLKQI